MIYIVNINDKEYEVEVEKGKANLIKTAQVIAAVPSTEVVKIESNNTFSETSITSKNVKGDAIKSPMPGTILDIKVNVGEKVKKGQLVIILEAMKMENEIFAQTDGIVAQIIVSKGSAVSTNDNLMIIQ